MKVYNGNHSRRFLFEADEDNTGADPNLADPPADTAGDDPNTADNNTEDTTGDETNNETENNNDNTGNNDQENDTEDNEDTGDNEEDFTIDDADNGGDEGDTGEEGEADPNADTEENTDRGDENNDDQPEVDPDSLKAKDAELFDSLSPEEQKMKIKVQKKMFLELYTNADIIIKKINEIGSESEELMADSFSYGEMREWFFKKFPEIKQFHEKRAALMAA